MSVGNGRGDVELLRAEIQRTRAELGETVQALAAKADVKARMRESAQRTRQRVRERAAHTSDMLRRNRVPLAVAAVGAAAIAAVLVVLRGGRG